MSNVTDEHLDLLERALIGIENDYKPTCESVNYGSGCPGATDASIDFWRRAADCTQAMITELRSRRQADLTPTECSDLHYLVGFVEGVRGMEDGERPANGVGRGLSVVDRLLAGKGR
jgi:hypothetical protein